MRRFQTYQELLQIVEGFRLFYEQSAVADGTLFPEEELIKSDVRLLAYRATSEEIRFMKRLASAIETHIASCQLIEINQKMELFSHLYKSGAKLVLGFKEAFQSASIFCTDPLFTHQIVTTKSGGFLPLESPFVYDKEPRAKRELWEIIKRQTTHALPQLSSTPSTNP